MIEAATELGPSSFVTVATAVSVIGAAVAGAVAAYSIKRDVGDLKTDVNDLRESVNGDMSELKHGIIPRSTFRLWIAEARDRTKIDLPRLHEIDENDERAEAK